MVDPGQRRDEVVDLVLVRELVRPHQLLPEDLGVDRLPVRPLERPERVHQRRELPPLAGWLAQKDPKVSLGLGLRVRQHVLDHLVHQRDCRERVVLGDLVPQEEPGLCAGDPYQGFERPRGRAYLPFAGAPPQLQVVFLDPVLRLHREHGRVVLRERDVLLEQVELDGGRLYVRPLPVDVQDVRGQLLVLPGDRRVSEDENKVKTS